MQDLDITNPPDEIKLFTKILVEKLSQLPLEEEIELLENSIIDSIGNIIITFPWKKNKNQKLNQF